MIKKLLLPVSLLALTGCMAENPYYDRYEPDSVEALDTLEYQYAGNLELLTGHMRGDVGPVRDLDSDASLLTGYGDETYASVEVHADGPSGVAMNLVEVYGGLDALEPGSRITYRNDRETRDYGDVGVLVLNCAGEQRYSWDYDQPADEVDVEVTDLGQGVTRVDYTARTFERDPFTGIETGSASEVDGHFEVVR